MSKFWVVALETYKKNVKSVTFLIMILAPFVMIALSMGGGLIGREFASEKEMAVVADSEQTREQFLKVAGSDLDIDKNIKTVAEAEKSMQADDGVDGYLTITTTGDSFTGSYLGKSSMAMESEQKVTGFLTQLQLGATAESLALTSEDVAKIMAPASFSQKEIEFVDGKPQVKKNNKFVSTMVGFFVLMAIYMIVFSYANVTAQEVASEKGTRIMEIILSSTTAAKHFYGKIMGITMVIMTQVLIYLAAGLGAYLVVQNMDFVQSFLANMSIKELLQSLLGFNLLYLLFGVLAYTILAAFSGSLVAKAEDASKAVTPVTYLVLLGFFPSIFLGMSNPQHILIKILSYIPFMSSFAMPMRLADGSVTTTEVLISLGLLAVTIVFLLRFSAKVYKSTILVYGDKGMMQTFKEGVRFSK